MRQAFLKYSNNFFWKELSIKRLLLFQNEKERGIGSNILYL